MKRSEINNYINEAKCLFFGVGFKLPPFAFWTPEYWQGLGGGMSMKSGRIALVEM
jgi:D-lyxose ketol-isomerase